MSYGLVLTNAGAVEIETAYHAGATVEIVSVALGDGGGTPLPDTPPELAQVMQLAGQFGSEAFSGAETAEGMISGRVVIPCATYPGKTLREVGLVSASGTLIAYGIYPETYIPDEGAAVLKEITITTVLALTYAENVSIQVDPYTAIITQETGDERYLQQRQNLADIDDAATARKNLGLGSVGNFMAVQQGGGTGMKDNKIYAGWSGKKVLLQIDDTPMGALFYEKNPPTAEQTGAYPKTGGRVDGEVWSEVGNNYRLVGNNRGVFWRFDANNMYLMFTDDGDPHGGYNALRPLIANCATGALSTGHDFSAGGNVYSGGGASRLAEDGNVYGSVWDGFLNIWVLAQINALNVALNNQISASISNNNDQWVLANFQLKNTANLGSGWEKDSATGRIRQWGFLNAGATTGFFQVNFPITFPNTCANVQVTVVSGGGSKFADNFATAGNVTQSGFTCGQDTGGSYWEAIGW